MDIFSQAREKTILMLGFFAARAGQELGLMFFAGRRNIHPRANFFRTAGLAWVMTGILFRALPETNHS